MNGTAKTKMAYWAGALVVAVWLTGFAGAAMAASKVALVIGNGEYKKFDDLSSPVRDAQAIESKLRALGFRLVGGQAHVNVDRDRMLTLLDELYDWLKSLDRQRIARTAVVYYSGHGASYKKDNWLVPVNDEKIQTREDLTVHAVGTETVLNHLTETKDGGLNIVFLDACRDYSLKSRHKARTKGSQTTKGLVRMDPPSNAAIVYAAKEGEVAYESEHGGLSPFTEALLARIHVPGKSVLRVLSETALAVEEATKHRRHGAQKPFLSETQLAGMNLDQIFFVECPRNDPECVQTIIKTEHAEHEIAYENARNINTIMAYYSVITGFPGTSSANMAQQDIGKLVSANFSRPPQGRNRVLNVAEIKWCLRQKAWLQMLHEPATRDARLNRVYNRNINDYHNRCGDYRYQGNDLLRAEKWIDEHSNWIAASLPSW